MGSNTEKKPWTNIQNQYENEANWLRATTFATYSIVWRAITIWGAIKKRSHEPIYKNEAKLSKEIKSDNYMGSNREKLPNTTASG